ncbi:hypothetical protein K437DRAFT_15786 [Tilletiaria anomala UBC 951]|uniref:Uncharacterized protein n=1 Tax=Tilletiaria anomala (strain ATCC 24038 / CBS 436.72 / UBC 951) TaxID=1037660 RepID=A0A066WMT5_TILAU|nr:uncharacterized protein K437DRAFT_15786 [Tilletiaria anomala UBC 951]KDN52309.1 hypothetical protein K437DRAFT_15786 [Tilletiaria anomala UBC 951]
MSCDPESVDGGRTGRVISHIGRTRTVRLLNWSTMRGAGPSGEKDGKRKTESQSFVGQRTFQTFSCMILGPTVMSLSRAIHNTCHVGHAGGDSATDDRDSTGKQSDWIFLRESAIFSAPAVRREPSRFENKANMVTGGNQRDVHRCAICAAR